MAKLRIHEIHYLCWVAQGFPSYEKLADQLGVSVNSIKKEAQRHDWVYKRNKMTFSGDVNVTQDPEEVTDKERIDQIQRIIYGAIGKVGVNTTKDVLNLIEIRDNLINDREVQDILSWSSMDVLKAWLAICEFSLFGAEGIPDPDVDPDPQPTRNYDPCEIARVIFDGDQFLQFATMMEENQTLIEDFGKAMMALEDPDSHKTLNSITGEINE